MQTWNLYNKRSAAAGDDIDPWGHYLFVVPVTYRTTLKWFTSSLPTADIGVAGDYCMLWGGFTNYGMQPSIFGPKQASDWPENGNGPSVPIAPATALTVLPVGLSDEGATLNMSSSTQLIAIGLTSEVIFPLPVNVAANASVQQLGLQSGPAQITVTINSLYTAEDQHGI